jgi:hypothetical protein
MRTKDASNVDHNVSLSVVVGVYEYEMGGFGELMTITQIESDLWVVSGKPIMKSMLMSSHFQSKILKGCNNPLSFM